MAYWIVLAKTAGADLSKPFTEGEGIRGEMIRFALFWHLCSSNNAKGGLQAFRFLRKWADELDPPRDGATGFPGRELYQTLTGDDRSALSLVPPDAIRAYGAQQIASSKWRSWKARFEREGFEEPIKIMAGTKDLYRTWWWSRGKMLLWLQRSYLEKEFAGYDPSSDRDDEKPFDLDHIQPQAVWDFDWRQRNKRIEDRDDHDHFGDGRDQVGNGIGNLRWIGSSENRSDGSTGLVEKLGLKRSAQAIGPIELDHWMTSAFNARDRLTVDLWIEAGADGAWTKTRMQAFQQAVEERAAWLFQQLWTDAHFRLWFDEGPNY